MALRELMQSLPPVGFDRLCQHVLRESGFQHVEVTGKHQKHTRNAEAASFPDP